MEAKTMIVNSTVHQNNMNMETIIMTTVGCLKCGTHMQIPPSARILTCGKCQALNEFTQTGLNAQPAIQRWEPSTPSHAFPRWEPSMHSHSLPHMGAFINALPCLPPSLLGRKKAVICGISYLGSRYELTGGIQDAIEMRSFLIDCGFPQFSVMMLTEKETDPYKVPTKENLRRALHWLVQGCQAGDSLVFQYSGHGARLPNHIEGKDHEHETLCPLDFETHGMITAEEINAAIVNPIPQGVKLHAFIDASNNGNILDLPYFCKRRSAGEYVWVDCRSRPDVWKRTSGGEAISLCVRVDDQTFGDNTASSRKSTCELPRCLSEGYKHGSRCTYYRVMLRVRFPEPVNRFWDLVNLASARLLTSGSQVALLTACGPFDILGKQYTL